MLKEAKRPTLHLRQEKPTAAEAKAAEAPPPAQPTKKLDVGEGVESVGQRDTARRGAQDERRRRLNSTARLHQALPKIERGADFNEGKARQ
jgi:hypothetical protein